MKNYMILAILVLGLLVVGCNPVTTPVDEFELQDFSGAEIKRVSSVDELTDIFSSSPYAYYGGDRVLATGTFTESLAMDSAVGSPSSKRDYSETNIQVQGVDEADLLKTDGEFVYTISNNNLFIVKAYPGDEAKVLSVTSFKDNPDSLFLHGDRLVVMGHVSGSEVFRGRGPYQQASFVQVYDISDKSSPVLMDEFKVEGSYFEARLKDDHAYIFTQTYGGRDIIIPMVMENDVQREIPLSSIYYFDYPYNHPVMVNVFSLDLESNDLGSNSFVVESSVNLYVSHDNIFLTHTSFINEEKIYESLFKKMLEPKLSSADKQLIADIEATPSSILSRAEKDQKILEVYERVVFSLSREEEESLEEEFEVLLEEEMAKIEHFELTGITKIGYKDGKLTPQQTGQVPGRILNQFSMDEDVDNQVFRIATTISPRWNIKDRTLSTNNVYTLDEDLNILGRLEGLAEDERIYSARFMGDRLYMVTFREVDPFFVIDLSNPRDIKNLGELKIPGFSTYLHPYDDNTIIGIGQEANNRGEIQGLKISLFDVSNPASPIEISKYVGDDKFARSNALFEHKAFLFDKQRDLLVIPVFNFDYRDSSNNYDGALVFNITKENIELRGLINHPGSTDSWRYSPGVERSFFIEDLLYTKSSSLLRINDVWTLESVSNVTLTGTSKIPVY